MKKLNMILFIMIMVILGAISAFAQPAIVGGIRDGVALGILLEKGTESGAKLRFEFEANTTATPVVASIGGKWFLTDVDSRFPMSFGAGAVAYLGNRSALGPYVSVIFDRFMDVTPLFLEVGVDVAEEGQLQLQMGYYF